MIVLQSTDCQLFGGATIPYGLLDLYVEPEVVVEFKRVGMLQK